MDFIRNNFRTIFFGIFVFLVVAYAFALVLLSDSSPTISDPSPRALLMFHDNNSNF